MSLSNELPDNITSMPTSALMEILQHGSGHDDLVRLWMGEGSLPTPDFICQQASASLQRGETFYTFQRGIPSLRCALRDYHNRLYKTDCDVENFIVTGGGMQSVTLALQLVCCKKVAMLTPAWPNFAAIAQILRLEVHHFPLSFNQLSWSIDLDHAFAFLKKNKIDTLFLNTPCNPCGWVASHEELKEIVAFCRKNRIWIICDEVYARYCFDGQGEAIIAPSVLQHCDDSDRVIVVNTFSKNWSMTGWRIGFMYVPTRLIGCAENLVQYNTSGVPEFSQHGAIAALSPLGESYLQEQIHCVRAGFELAKDFLSSYDKVDFSLPRGSFYLFIELPWVDDSLSVAKHIVDRFNVGLAPGCSFGVGLDSYFRLCVLNSSDILSVGLSRFCSYLDSC